MFPLSYLFLIGIIIVLVIACFQAESFGTSSIPVKITYQPYIQPGSPSPGAKKATRLGL